MRFRTILFRYDLNAPIRDPIATSIPIAVSIDKSHLLDAEAPELGREGRDVSSVNILGVDFID